MEMRIHRYDPVHIGRQQPADDPLADRLAPIEGRILAHVTKIWRQQNEPPGALAPQRFGGEQDRNQLVIGAVERDIKDCRRCCRAGRHAQFAVGEAMQRDCMQGNTKPRREPRRIACGGRQALDRDGAHRVASADSGPSMA
jgi:hypothetical protein